jgi:hypothetical protein
MKYKLKATIVVIILALTVGCTTGKIVRDSQTYTAEVMSGLLREKLAAKHLLEAAKAAKAAGDTAKCEAYAKPALLIQAKAQGQAFRALWLAGLNYPKADGSIPKSGEEQADPGPTGSVASVATVCGQ